MFTRVTVLGHCWSQDYTPHDMALHPSWCKSERKMGYTRSNLIAPEGAMKIADHFTLTTVF